MDTGTPRFFIDAIQFYNTMGMIESMDNPEGYFFNYKKVWKYHLIKLIII